MIVIAGATLFSIGAIIQYYFIEGFPFSARLGDPTFTGAMPTDLISFTTTYASILALQLFTKITQELIKYYLAPVLITTAATLITQSRGALIGLCASFIILCFANKRILFFVVLTPLLIFFMPGMSDRIKNESIENIEFTIISLNPTLILFSSHPFLLALAGLFYEKYNFP